MRNKRNVVGGTDWWQLRSTKAGGLGAARVGSAAWGCAGGRRNQCSYRKTPLQKYTSNIFSSEGQV
jgi:hypothetical protein